MFLASSNPAILVTSTVHNYSIKHQTPARTDGRLTDMLSFYTLPSTVINNPLHSKLSAAFQYYTVPGATPLMQLMGDALTLAHNTCATCSSLLMLLRITCAHA